MLSAETNAWHTVGAQQIMSSDSVLSARPAASFRSVEEEWRAGGLPGQPGMVSGEGRFYLVQNKEKLYGWKIFSVKD